MKLHARLLRIPSKYSNDSHRFSSYIHTSSYREASGPGAHIPTVINREPNECVNWAHQIKLIPKEHTLQSCREKHSHCQHSIRARVGRAAATDYRALTDEP